MKRLLLEPHQYKMLSIDRISAWINRDKFTQSVGISAFAFAIELMAGLLGLAYWWK